MEVLASLHVLSLIFLTIHEIGGQIEPVAQLVEHRTFNPVVEGSNPSWLTVGPHRLARPRTPAFHAGSRGSNPLGDVKTKGLGDYSLQGLFC